MLCSQQRRGRGNQLVHLVLGGLCPALHQGFEDFWPHTVPVAAPDGAGGGNVRLTPKQDRLLPRRKPSGDSEPWLVELSLVVGAA